MPVRFGRRLFCGAPLTIRAFIREIRRISSRFIRCAAWESAESCTVSNSNVATDSVQDWTSDLSRLDENRRVRYWKGSAMLVFSDIEAEAQKYVSVPGRISDLKLNISTNRPAR